MESDSIQEMCSWCGPPRTTCIILKWRLQGKVCELVLSSWCVWGKVWNCCVQYAKFFKRLILYRYFSTTSWSGVRGHRKTQPIQSQLSGWLLDAPCASDYVSMLAYRKSNLVFLPCSRAIPTTLLPSTFQQALWAWRPTWKFRPLSSQCLEHM